MKNILLLWVFAAPFTILAQKKPFTFQQLFNNQFPQVYQSLPEVIGWADENHYLEQRNNDVYAVEALSGQATLYTSVNQQPALPEIVDAKNITASPDGKLVAYTKKNNLYIRAFSSGKETALTTDGSDSILNGYASWVYFEEILGRPSNYKAFWWSPDSKSIAFMHFNDSKVPIFPIYVADGQHGYLENERYPKAGDYNPEVKIGVVPVTGGITVWADFNETDDQYFGQPLWTPDNELWVPWMNRGQDQLVIHRVDKTNGKKKELYTEKQDTWVNFPDINQFSFLSDNKRLIFISDKDGWENLYLHDRNGKLINRISNGHFWGTTILYTDEKNKQVYLRARKDNTARFDIYKISFDGKYTSRLSTGNFTYDNVLVSPSGKYITAIYSNLSTPPAMVLMDNKGKRIREIGTIAGKEYDQYQYPETVLTSVRSSDDLFDLPVTITYPLNFDSTKKYPVWISIYGGPNSGSVYDRWKMGNSYTQWWAQEGVIQVSMDNRSSGHFGRKGINYVYQQLGIWEIEDYMTCGRWLRTQPWVDSTKIGITGGSFGGYLTGMALTYGSDVFNFGIAYYPVTDWKLYDTHYTERFMNTPLENQQGYEKTSVMNYGSKYKGVLRIVHGSTDDNVHFQNSLQLIDVLEDLNKHFELMIYPGQRHGIGQAKSAHTASETGRFIYRYLLNKPWPAEFRN